MTESVDLKTSYLQRHHQCENKYHLGIHSRGQGAAALWQVLIVVRAFVYECGCTSIYLWMVCEYFHWGMYTYSATTYGGTNTSVGNSLLLQHMVRQKRPSSQVPCVRGKHWIGSQAPSCGSSNPYIWVFLLSTKALQEDPIL